MIRRFELELANALEAIIATAPEQQSPEWSNARALIAKAKERRELHEMLMNRRICA